MPKVCPVCSTAYPDTNAFCSLDGSTLRTLEHAESLIGSVVADRYLVTELLGEGGMGTVYLARHVRLPQQAAIKILRPDLVRDPASVARFNREASNASRIEQEHVARVYDYGETADGLVFLAMEYVPGATLRHIIETEGPLPPRRTAELIRQIAAGLDAAHHLPQPLIHRDLKPDNVLVVQTPSGRDRAKVVDFGIAKAVGADDNGLTKTGFIVGTPEFMSPEQLLGEPLDARSDVYALALVAFMCLTGTLPFEMTTPERARMGRLVEQPRHLWDTMPNVSWPPALEAVLEDALNRDREQRPATAGLFAERLTAAIDDAWPDGGPARAARPAVARPPAPTPPTVRAPATRQRSRTAAIVAGGVLVAVIGGVVLTRDRQAQTEAQPPVAMTPSPVTDSIAAAPPIVGARVAAATAGAAPRARATERRVTDTAAGEASPDPAREAGSPARSLDSLVRTLDGDRVEAATARGIADSLRGLLPRLGRADRVRAQLGLVRASILVGDVGSACAALESAKSAARTDAQRLEIQTLNEQLGCD
ncbi:MAG: serine/threonine-protein kinase [Gemmatirosa sp.]